ESRGWTAANRLVLIRYERVTTFLLKRSPFLPTEISQLKNDAAALGFEVLYAPGQGYQAPEQWIDGTSTADYARLVTTTNRDAFFEHYQHDIRPTTDDRPFFFHTTKLKDQLDVAFGRSMLFGNGLSALLTLIIISVTLVVLFVVGPLLIADRGVSH